LSGLEVDRRPTRAGGPPATWGDSGENTARATGFMKGE